MAHTYPIIVNNAIVENNVLGFAVASRTGGNMWGGFGISNLNDDRGYILYSTFFDLTNFDTLSWTKSGSVSQQMWLQNESGQNVATLIDYTNHSNTNATPFNCSNLSGMYRFALYTNTNSSGSSSWSASVRLDSLYVSDNRWYVDAYSNPSGTSTFSGLGSYTDNADVSLQSNPIGGYGFVNWKLKGYTRLEYIQSSGTQWIDCGVSVNYQTEKVVADVSFSSLNSNNVVSGHNYGSFSWNINMLYTNNNQLRWGELALTNEVSANTRYKFEYTSSYLDMDGTRIATSSKTYTNGYNNTIFYVGGQYGKLKLYSFKLYDGSTLIRDFIPCLRHSDGSIGLLDLVELKFYGNSGSGSFIGGNIL